MAKSYAEICKKRRGAWANHLRAKRQIERDPSNESARYRMSFWERVAYDYDRQLAAMKGVPNGS